MTTDSTNFPNPVTRLIAPMSLTTAPIEPGVDGVMKVRHDTAKNFGGTSKTGRTNV